MKHRVNISIDDVSPHSLSGLNVIDRCVEVLEKHPDVKFTLFVPTAYWRTCSVAGRVDTATPEPLYIWRHHDFAYALKALPDESFEVGYHGRYHGIPGVSNNDEMRRLDARGFSDLWHAMVSDVQAANLFGVFKNILRPPAMYMSPDAIRTAASYGITLALSPRGLHTATYQGADIGLERVVYANVWIPDDSLPDVPVCDMELLYHACEWDVGYMSRERTRELIAWLDDHDSELEHVFMDGLVGR